MNLLVEQRSRFDGLLNVSFRSTPKWLLGRRVNATRLLCLRPCISSTRVNGRVSENSSTFHPNFNSGASTYLPGGTSYNSYTPFLSVLVTYVLFLPMMRIVCPSTLRPARPSSASTPEMRVRPCTLSILLR